MTPSQVACCGASTAEPDLRKGKKKKIFAVQSTHTTSFPRPKRLLEAGNAGLPRRNQQLRCLNRRGLDSLLSSLNLDMCGGGRLRPILLTHRVQRGRVYVSGRRSYTSIVCAFVYLPGTALKFCEPWSK